VISLEKILEIDLDSTEDLFECYNKKKVSRDLIQYMVDAMPRLKKNDTLKVVINNRIKGNVKCAELIKKAIDDACARNDFRFHLTNMKQIWFLILGVIALLVASIVDWEILKEIVIIGAWVLLWDVVEMEIVDDINNRKKKRILKKILSSEFIENIK
jgi:hypothetical protein